jgi:hypothetical protein
LDLCITLTTLLFTLYFDRSASKQFRRADGIGLGAVFVASGIAPSKQQCEIVDWLNSPMESSPKSVPMAPSDGRIEQQRSGRS